MIRLILPLMLFAAPAQAALTVCNQTDATASVAIGYSEAGTWTSEGWWVTQPGDCRTVVGGDLGNRFYYWRATSDRHDWEDQNFYFCTASDAFTILGDTDCADRGYARVRFNEIDTGDATDWTLNLTAGTPSPATAPTPERGSLGEPYTINGLLSHCQVYDASMACEVHADGFTYIASSANHTPLATLEQLDSLGVNTPVTISGDMTGYWDSTAEVTIATWRQEGTDRYSDLRYALQGLWTSEDDPQWSILVHGSTVEDLHAGMPGGTATLHIADTCPGLLGDGPVVILAYSDAPDDPLCWSMIGWDAVFFEAHPVGAMNSIRMWKQ